MRVSYVEPKIDSVRKLVELADLKQMGILTEDEFQSLKIKLLEKILNSQNGQFSPMYGH